MIRHGFKRIAAALAEPRCRRAHAAAEWAMLTVGLEFLAATLAKQLGRRRAAA